jgi:dihydrofolate synthase/folylpolyglutamate synthase
VVLDGAHNPGGARALAASLRAYFPGRPVTFVLGISGDKDQTGILSALLPLAERVVFTAADSPRASDPETLRALAEHLGPLPAGRLDVVARPADALARARRESPSGLVCAAGSLFLLGELLADQAETLDGLCGADAG